MGPREENTFFLYGVGLEADVLCLGNLVLGDYSNPTTSRHYTHRQLNDLEIEQHASVATLGECQIRSSSKRSPGISIYAAGFSELSFSFKSSEEVFITARSGKRIVLKKPEEFLNGEVLKVPQAQDELRKWLSAARTDRILKLRDMWKPRIWMLTGAYVLQDARAFHVREKEVDSSFGTGSNTPIDLLTIPVGGSISLGNGRSLTSQIAYEGSYVWAAQYRLLEAKYLKIKPKQDMVSSPSTFLLYPNFTSKGVLRGNSTSDFEPSRVQVSIPDGPSEEDMELGQSDKEQLYSERLEHEIQAIESFL